MIRCRYPGCKTSLCSHNMNKVCFTHIIPWEDLKDKKIDDLNKIIYKHQGYLVKVKKEKNKKKIEYHKNIIKTH